jgi:hypothetical protein
MAIEQKQINYAREIDDVVWLLVSLVKDIKAGKTIPEVVAGSVSSLVAALNGLDQLDDEIAANKQVAFQTIGYRVGELAGAILEKKV